jgi:4-hydroxy-tetrahydrodipicolinate synthase
MNSPYLITAICTPLTENEDLHREGLARHIEDQLEHGLDGILAGGTMGLMQLLKDSTYRDLVHHSAKIVNGRAELLVGVGDTSFVRTRDRIRQAEEAPVDGVVILTPYCYKFRQSELIDYFQSLADISAKPVYLYDLPQMTGSKVEIETVRALAKHPNIRGIKCSDHLVNARPLLDAVPDGFRVILAQPLLMDILLRSGINEHLDGIYGVVPHWFGEMKRAAVGGDWNRVAAIQRDVAALMTAIVDFPAPLFACVAELLRHRGVAGNPAPAPIRPLSGEQRAQLLARPIIQKAVETRSAAGTAEADGDRKR